MNQIGIIDRLMWRSLRLRRLAISLARRRKPAPLWEGSKRDRSDGMGSEWMWPDRDTGDPTEDRRVPRYGVREFVCEAASVRSVRRDDIATMHMRNPAACYGFCRGAESVFDSTRSRQPLRTTHTRSTSIPSFSNGAIASSLASVSVIRTFRSPDWQMRQPATTPNLL